MPSNEPLGTTWYIMVPPDMIWLAACGLCKALLSINPTSTHASSRTEVNRCGHMWTGDPGQVSLSVKRAGEDQLFKCLKSLQFLHGPTLYLYMRSAFSTNLRTSRLPAQKNNNQTLMHLLCNGHRCVGSERIAPHTVDPQHVGTRSLVCQIQTRLPDFLD